MCRDLNYFEYFLFFVSVVTGYVIISDFPTLFGVPVDIASSRIGLNICRITAENKKYKSFIAKKKNRKNIIK